MVLSPMSTTIWSIVNVVHAFPCVPESVSNVLSYAKEHMYNMYMSM